MKTSLVSVASVVDEWKSDTTFEGDISPDKLMRWANDAAAKFMTDEQLVVNISLLNVFDYRANLPDNFKFINQAAYRRKEQGCIPREQIVEWQFDTLDGSGCKFKVNLDCPKCHKTSCGCDSPIVTIDADVLWASSHPETQVAHVRHFFDFGGNTQRYGKGSQTFFKLMRPAQNTFFAAQAFLSGCQSFEVDNIVEYRVEHPNILVNFREGQVLLSYMGVKTDDAGWLMIPDNPYVFEAIHYTIEEKLAHAEYRKRKDQGNRVYYMDMKQSKELAIGRARNKLQIPSADEWMAMMQNHFSKILPYWRHETNYNRMTPDAYVQPDETYSVNGK
jgi:hypothetical protein